MQREHPIVIVYNIILLIPYVDKEDTNAFVRANIITAVLYTIRTHRPFCNRFWFCNITWILILICHNLISLLSFTKHLPKINKYPIVIMQLTSVVLCYQTKLEVYNHAYTLNNIGDNRMFIWVWVEETLLTRFLNNISRQTRWLSPILIGFVRLGHNALFGGLLMILTLLIGFISTLLLEFQGWGRGLANGLLKFYMTNPHRPPNL